MLNKQAKEIKKGFVWYSVRTLVWIILVLLLYDWLFVENEGLSFIIGIIWVILSLPLFILAIIHLNIYKKEGRGDAIWSLIISGIALGTFLLGISAGSSGTNGEEWQVITDTTISLESNHAYKVFGETYGEIIPTKYNVQSDKPLTIKWVKSSADCDLALNGLEFMNYPSCQPSTEGIYEFTSTECNVPSDSGLCIINSGQESARVKIITEKKI